MGLPNSDVTAACTCSMRVAPLTSDDAIDVFHAEFGVAQRFFHWAGCVARCAWSSRNSRGEAHFQRLAILKGHLPASGG